MNYGTDSDIGYNNFSIALYEVSAIWDVGNLKFWSHDLCGRAILHHPSKFRVNFKAVFKRKFS